MKPSPFIIAFIVALASLTACKREPAIVIRFEPADMAGRDLARPADLKTIGEAASDAPNDKAKRAECTTDADCAIVPDGCCGCANGGKQRAALKRDEARLQVSQRAACKEVMCTMMVSTDPTCGKRATCQEGKCAMRDARPDEVVAHKPK